MDYLKRCKQTTPEQRFAWLAAAWDFAASAEQAQKKSKTRTSRKN